LIYYEELELNDQQINIILTYGKMIK